LTRTFTQRQQWDEDIAEYELLTGNVQFRRRKVDYRSPVS